MSPSVTIVKPEAFAYVILYRFGHYLNLVSWVESFLSYFKYDIICIYPTLASLRFATSIEHYMLNFFTFGFVELSLVRC